MKIPTFIKNVATLTSGKAIAMAISILALPVISRLFHPDVYGMAALYVSMAAILAAIGTLSFSQAITLPEKDKAAGKLFLLSVVSLVIWAAMLWFALLVIWLLIGNPYPNMDIWLWTLPIAVTLLGMQQTTENWITRKRCFKTSATGDVGEKALTIFARIAGGLQYGSYLWPLIAGYLLGLVGRLLIYIKIYPLVISNIKGISIDELISTAHEYRQFPFYNMPAALSFSLNAQLPMLVIGFFFTAVDVGHYAMVQGLLVTTTMMVGESVRRVYLHRTTQIQFTATQLRADYRKILMVMGSIALLPAAFLVAYGEPLFVLLLGDKWADAGRFSALLTPWFYMQWLSMPATALMVRLKKQRFWLFFQQVLLWGQIVGMITGYAIAGTVMAVLLGFVIVRVSLLLFLLLRVHAMILDVTLLSSNKNKV